MELCSFWVINPADGQEGKPEPIKLIFFDNGDLILVSIAEDLDYRGAYRLPAGSYQYTGEAIIVPNENLGKIISMVQADADNNFKSRLSSLGLVNDQEWQMFYTNPRAWKSLRILAVAFGNDE